MRIHYLVLCLFLLPHLAPAQPKITGLGNYRIGITTPDSLQKATFIEKDQPFTKGTLTLPCTHIRTFTAAKIELGNVTITNLELFFYDSKLFRISCDYSDDLAMSFIRQYGKGKSRPVNRFSFCNQGNNETMQIWGEVWQNGDILAVALHAKGYNTDCQMEQIARLTVISQPVSILSSDCDLQPGNILSEEFDEVINNL